MGKPSRLSWTIAGIAVLLPAAAVGGGMLLAPLQAIAGLVAASVIGRHYRAGAAALLVVALVIWTGLSTLWSSVDRPEQALKIAGALLTGLALITAVGRSEEPDGALIRASLIAALIMICVLAGVEAGFGMPINRLDEPATDPGILERNPGKGVSILVALLWPALGMLAGVGRWRLALAGALALATGLLALQFHMAANAAGFLAGAAGFALGWLAPRQGPLLVSGIVAGWVLLAPWVTPLLLRLPGMETLPLSWRMRGDIWRFASERIAERPLVGWGLDGSRLFGDTILQIDGLDFRAIPLHPHSASIQVWLELGAGGALLAAAAILAAGRAGARLAANHRARAAALTGAIAAIGLIWNVSFGAWQEWWMATAILALALTSAVRRV
jgi:O-antigen ligase